MNITQILAVARKHLGNGAAMESSARLCMADAIKAHDEGDFETAKRRAVKSLAYTVGIGHPDYQRAAA
jgi:hypothetical protein